MNYQPYLAAVAALGVVSCTPDAPLNAPSAQASSPVTHRAPAPRYVALPGQAPVAVSTDVDAAFEQQAAAYAGQPATPAIPATPIVAAQPAAPMSTPATPLIPATPSIPTTPAVTPATPAAQPAVTIPLPGSTPEASPLPQGTDAAQPTAPAAPTAGLPTAPSALTPAAPAPVQEHENPAATGTMNYKIRITNNTEGRLFVEAQDAGGAIYPCGFMEGGRTFTTPMENSAPIKGPITVVVRDPDQPDAPEIRRYKVDPPAADYNGKAIGISILSGGRYVASLDGQTYAASPAAAPTPQPAPEAAAPTPETPAPEPAPAGI